jgi:hypothetical protein
MWRREQGLDFWLKGKKSDPELKRSASGKTKLAEKFLAQPFKGGVSECPLAIHSEPVSVGTVIPEPVKVIDGMDFIGPGQQSRKRDPAATEPWEAPAAVRPIPLIRISGIGAVRFPDAKSMRIRQSLMSITPYCRRLPAHMDPAPVQNIKMVQFSPPAAGRTGSMLIGAPGVRNQTSRISGMALHRSCADLRILSEADIHAYRSEAAVSRGIPEEDCELIALFRHVPIEMISKLRFLDSTRELVYTITGGMNRTRTRIYDLMVVRDGSTNEVHLVPHRTSNRMVYLN